MISGAMQNFVAALTAAGPAPPWMVWAQFGVTNAGAALVAAGRSSGLLPLVGTGGTAFLAGILLLGVIVLRARRLALHLRHRVRSRCTAPWLVVSHPGPTAHEHW